MADRPIIMSGESVRAILAGRKTQTRRVVRFVGAETVEERDFDGENVEHWLWSPQHDDWIACPYGAPGDRLWVREAFAYSVRDHEQTEDGWRESDHPDNYDIVYRADGETGDWVHYDADGNRTRRPPPWRSPLYMPRWASRLTLKVASVRVERVQDITSLDAVAEGVFGEGRYATRPPLPYPVATFAVAWDAINGRRPGCAWDDNPWVWVVGFRRLGAAKAQP